MFFPALLDANVLVPMPLADLVLRLAEAETYRPLWSEQVLDEVERTLVFKFGLTSERARRRIGDMRTEFPDAMVTDFEPLIEVMTNDSKDRHVLAAAVRANVEIIVTDNVKHFPARACDPYDISVVSPDEFLLDQLDLYEAETLQCLREQIEDLTRPPISMSAFLEQFRKTVPNFVDEVTPLLTR